MFGDTTLWQSSFFKDEDLKQINHERSNVIHFRPYQMVKRRKTAIKIKRSSLPR